MCAGVAYTGDVDWLLSSALPRTQMWTGGSGVGVLCSWPWDIHKWRALDPCGDMCLPHYILLTQRRSTLNS